MDGEQSMEIDDPAPLANQPKFTMPDEEAISHARVKI